MDGWMGGLEDSPNSGWSGVRAEGIAGREAKTLAMMCTKLAGNKLENKLSAKAVESVVLGGDVKVPLDQLLEACVSQVFG